MNIPITGANTGLCLGVTRPAAIEPDRCHNRGFSRLDAGGPSIGTKIKVSTIYPGYIRTYINRFAMALPFEVYERSGSRAMLKAIERKQAESFVPSWPWSAVGVVLKTLPDRLLAKQL